MSQKPLVSVLCATLPERSAFLREHCASVKAQTLRSREHIVIVDTLREGFATVINRAAAASQGRWIFILGDDDMIVPGCLTNLVQAAEGHDGAVIYGPPLVWGEDGAQFCGEPPTIGPTALIPLQLWRSVGGYDESLDQQEDRDLWIRMQERGITFVRYDEQPTWIYRFWRKPNGEPGNKSRRQGQP